MNKIADKAYRQVLRKYIRDSGKLVTFIDTNQMRDIQAYAANVVPKILESRLQQLRQTVPQISAANYRSKGDTINKIFIDRDVWRNKLKGLPELKRMLINHEMWHNKAPRILRDSEALAHFYGNYKAGLGLKSALKAALRQII
jgi:hypothetical protein